MTDSVKYHDIIVYAVIYFFFNSFLLPHGLLYTTILTPVMLYFLYRERAIKPLMFLFVLIIIPVPFHILSGVDLTSYLISFVMLLTVAVLLITSYTLMVNSENTFEKIFRTVLHINGVLIVVALLLLPVPGIREILWYDEILTKGLEVIPRLKLFTYEASYYSLIMMPVFLFFILRTLYGTEKHSMLIMINVLVSILLSLSFGVVGAMIPALIISILINWKNTPITLHRFTVLGSLSFFLILIGLLFIWPDNPIFFRISNIFEGKDTSAMGRLVYSFMFAKDLILQFGVVFGVGPGQVKILAHDMIVQHYKYYGDIAEIVRIPNSMAEMLAIFGIYGSLLKLFAEIFFFIKLKIYNNIYSLSMFLFIFIYQFTGSFITNSAEIVIWAMVFGLRFGIFEVGSNN